MACKENVDESHLEACNFVRDIMHSLGINFFFDTAEISWYNSKIHTMQHSSRNAQRQLGGCLGTMDTECTT
jgi:hypothetical protein